MASDQWPVKSDRESEREEDSLQRRRVRRGFAEKNSKASVLCGIWYSLKTGLESTL